MKRAIRYRTASIAATLLVGVVGGFIALVACSNQGEGERCDSLNGDDDCKTDQNLACYPATLLNNTNSDRCCPRDRSKATHPVCLTPVNPVGTDAQAPADTGPSTQPEASVTDASDGSTTADAADADGG